MGLHGWSPLKAVSVFCISMRSGRGPYIQQEARDKGRKEKKVKKDLNKKQRQQVVTVRDHEATVTDSGLL